MKKLFSKSKSKKTHKYETIFILKPDMEDGSRNSLREKIKSFISKKGGKVHVLEESGKFRLAYEIRKEMKGYFHYLGFEAEPTVLPELEKNLRINESVIKFQSFRIMGDFDSTIFPMESVRSAPMTRTKGRGSGGFEERGGAPSSFRDNPDVTQELTVENPPIKSEKPA